LHGAGFGRRFCFLVLRITATTLFVSAFLLFTCQPMAGKMLLPYLGGAASVWTTCVLFFQLMLLLGYVYAHVLARVTGMGKQIVTHAIVLLLPLAFLPIQFGAVSSESFALHPLSQLLVVLIASTGVPFFVVSTSAPLLQNWFSRSRQSASSDPYFLYAASNAGSLLALIAYPFLVEPRLGANAQSRLWFGGYIGLVLLFGATVAVLYQYRAAAVDGSSSKPPEWKTRLYWTGASFVPSGLMLAVTNHIAANVGSAPFLWLVPLGLYLLTFILAFARRMRVSSAGISKAIPFVLLGVFPLVSAGVVAPPGLNWILIGGHLLLLFTGALLCHTRLAESRPDAQQLTEFYFWVALGGVLGGLFTATLAPALFTTVLEYPLLVATLPFFRGGKFERSDLMMAAILAAAVILVWVVFRTTHLDSDTEAVAFAHTAILFIGYKLGRRPQRFAWMFAVLVLAYSFILPAYIEGAGRVYVARNFFGVKKVLDEPTTHLRKLLHGDTIHGIESTDPARTGQPLSYYYPGGSVSDVMELLRSREGPQRIGVLGLGSGTMAAYGDSDRHITFYEIDPSIEVIARRYFTFLPRCGSNCDVITGDGRLQLAREPNGAFDLLLLDAFSSDSVPAHLVSREALQMYLSKLKPDGILLFHVSNRYLNVEKLVSALVLDGGLVALTRFDDAGELRSLGKSSANHLAAARRPEHLQSLSRRPGWRPIELSGNFQPWTDDYSNLLSLIRWR
jgi:SAM-dependent methyltransferase